MNLNAKIKPFTGDGIPAYNEKFNQLIEAVNWLMGVRTINGRPVRESDQGPVIDLSQANMTQPGAGLGATDPDGNKAGWIKVLTIDPDYTTSNVMFNMWVWSGGSESLPSIPWMQDPNGVQAQWVQHQVCVDGQTVNKWFWGTP